VTLKLARSTKYPERGTPENFSPYRGTPLVLAEARPTAKPAKQAPAAAPAAKEPAAKQPAAKQPTAKQPAAKQPAAKELPAKRPPAFAVPGAPPEPLKEMPLVDRARLLSSWLDAHSNPSDANVRHFLYQHAWIVTGARFGWWHGAEALRVLIDADRKAERLWGVGARSELTARSALAEVGARSR
jgi:hypothetical protein